MRPPSEIDLAIAEIIDASPLGRKWVGMMHDRMALESSLLRLHSRGLSRSMVAEMWHAGDRDLARRAEAMTDEQIRQTNEAWLAS